MATGMMNTAGQMGGTLSYSADKAAGDEISATGFLGIGILAALVGSKSHR
jgi:hypothetical protein